mmetsp:Transcript_836/g.2995  ORF Transcript_836/g.2995 Transcript_836/m.2995 type:complete len:227 (+) Transcript_836:185-865(+)
MSRESRARVEGDELSAAAPPSTRRAVAPSVPDAPSPRGARRLAGRIAAGRGVSRSVCFGWREGVAAGEACLDLGAALGVDLERGGPDVFAHAGARARLVAEPFCFGFDVLEFLLHGSVQPLKLAQLRLVDVAAVGRDDDGLGLGLQALDQRHAGLAPSHQSRPQLARHVRPDDLRRRPALEHGGGALRVDVELLHGRLLEADVLVALLLRGRRSWPRLGGAGRVLL